MNLGTAFQLADDLLDFTAQDAILGKASGADLLEGKLTLPLILLVKNDPSVKGDLEKIMHDGDYENDSRKKILKRLESADLLAETRDTAYSFAGKAIKNLEQLPKSEYRVALEEIPSYMIERAK
jgi:octaprenyl-diphosphate synthase